MVLPDKAQLFELRRGVFVYRRRADGLIAQRGSSIAFHYWMKLSPAEVDHHAKRD
jgi:hypothetical protein